MYYITFLHTEDVLFGNCLTIFQVFACSSGVIYCALLLNKHLLVIYLSYMYTFSKVLQQFIRYQHVQAHKSTRTAHVHESLQGLTFPSFLCWFTGPCSLSTKPRSRFPAGFKSRPDGHVLCPHSKQQGAGSLRPHSAVICEGVQTTPSQPIERSFGSYRRKIVTPG